MTRISVITACRNPGADALRTAASIAAQVGPAIEWIVVDGASSDGTPAALRSLARPPDRLVSEPDGGIADAFNKGLAMATGEWISYLNAGDEFLEPRSLALLVREDRPWTAGGGVVQTAEGEELYRRLLPADGGFAGLLARSCRLIHPAVVLRTECLRQAGGFDLSFRSSMDYELWLRLWGRGLRPAVVHEAVAVFRLGGTSGDLMRRAREDRRARRMHGCGLGALGEARLLAGAWLKQRMAFLRRSSLAMRIKERW